MTYELVIFDLGGVVVEVESDRLIHQLAQLLGRSFEEVQRAIYHEDLLLPFELGRISATTYYDGLKGRLRLPWTYEQFVRSWNDTIRENPDVVAIAKRLKIHHRLVALSNTNELHLQHMKTTIPSLSMLERWVASCEVGCRKPEPEIYRLALAQVRVRPQAAIYIDDRPELVEAGRAAGLTAVRCENSRQLEQELRSLGLNI